MMGHDTSVPVGLGVNSRCWEAARLIDVKAQLQLAGIDVTHAF